MDSMLYRICKSDVVKGIVIAVIAAILTTVYGVVMTAGFDAFQTDWAEVGRLVVNNTLITFVSYIVKNLLTDSNGRVLGVFGK